MIVIRLGPVVSAGGAKTFNVTRTACGPPIPFTAASEIEPVYDPATRAADVTVTLKVALAPLATVAAVGDTASQPVPLVIVAVGVTVTLPVQAPVTPTVKACVAGFGFVPALEEKVNPVTEGARRVHPDCTRKLTGNVCVPPCQVKMTEPL